MNKKYLIIISIAIMAIVFFALVTRVVSDTNTDYRPSSIKNEITTIKYEYSGQTYTSEAYAGQIVMFLKDEQRNDFSVQKHKEDGVLCVLNEIPEVGYYLLGVVEGREGHAISQLLTEYPGSMVYPNSVIYSEGFATYVFDDFTDDHGELVTGIIKQQSRVSNNIYQHAIGEIEQRCERNLCKDVHVINSEKANGKLNEILAGASSEDKIVVNMSYGIPLLNDKKAKVKWNDTTLTDQNRIDYVKRYSDFILEYLNILAKYQDKDIVLVKSAGNSGVKSFDEVILESLYTRIESDSLLYDASVYKKLLEESFIFVSARDTTNMVYSNEVSSGNYHKLVTKVDISDWKDSLGKHHCGTSFAAPVVSGFLTKLSNEYDFSSERSLSLIKRVTKESKDNIINIDDVIVQAKLLKSAMAIPITDNGKYVDLALSSGTMWSTCNEGALSPEDLGYFYTKEAIEELYDKNADVFLGYSNFEKMTLGCRLPSKTQVEELMEECSWKYTDLNGVKGYDVIGSNGNSIFIPFAGALPSGYMRDDFDSESEFGVGYEGLYWVSDNSSDNDATYLMKLMRTENKLQTLDDRADAQFSVRPVMGGTFTENNRSEITEPGKRVHTERPDLLMLIMDLIGENIYDIEDWQLQIEDINSFGLEYENSSNNVYAAIIKMDVNVRMLHAVSEICVIYSKNPDATWSYDKFHVISTRFPKQEDFSEYVSVEDTYQEFGRSLTVTNNSAYDLFVAIECVWDKKKPESTYAVVKSNETKSVYYYFGRQPEYKIKFAYRI